MLRAFVAVLFGNLLGWASWTAAWSALPRVWSVASEDSGLLTRTGLWMLTGIMLAAPPVLIGAGAAWWARRAPMWVGLACGVWGLVLIQQTPVSFPIAVNIWYAPTVLVILSSTLGGWMLDLRAQAASRQT